MSRDQAALQDYLGHILEAINRIQQDTEGMDRTGFLCHQLVQDGVIRNLEIIGEAARNVERLSRFRGPTGGYSLVHRLRNAQRACPRLLQG